MKSHLSLANRKRTMHSAVNQPMHTASTILKKEEEREREKKKEFNNKQEIAEKLHRDITICCEILLDMIYQFEAEISQVKVSK